MVSRRSSNSETVITNSSFSFFLFPADTYLFPTSASLCCVFGLNLIISCNKPFTNSSNSLELVNFLYSLYANFLKYESILKRLSILLTCPYTHS